MSSALSKADFYITPEEYLADEQASDIKHEYLAGAVYAMSGVNIAHDRVAMNILTALRNQLRGKKCEAFSDDVKVRIVQQPGVEFYYYPDVSVDCSEPAPESYFVEQPVVISEVLSPSTERIDKGEKRINYQSLASLRVYVIVEPTALSVTVYRRDVEDWRREFLNEKSAVLQLPEIACALPLDAIYERMGF